jgi:hypothetical protein
MFFITSVKAKKSMTYFVEVEKSWRHLSLQFLISKSGNVYGGIYFNDKMIKKLKFKVTDFKMYDRPLFSIERFFYKLCIDFTIIEDMCSLLIRWDPE